MTSLPSRLCAVACAAGLALPAFAQSMSPVGAWNTIDDETKKVKSMVRITEKDGVLSGTVEKIVDPAKQDSKCDECAGDDPRKGKPVIGMTILTDLKKESDTVWSGGKILDPNNGKSYNAKVTVIDGGRKLEMRGSILFIGRTQTWVRAE
ncbi:DUF2147 domain-containing protein [Sulfuritalea hydrogenivorans]|jgi:uncharacterized protein (DUF2147 family)|uniref:DUF2147 domain-containing protein n=1 Tax=Sulfuritalea hydrogenivorans sk43H TaxID=1223802 RepID=W0SCT3_9PROT|nr:DUF2147 domain-containing protein [Sulfuritalea hydrogenivorans]BAO28570.1 hypothetical protein SUTH_00760 [Sulfuritalea hydrogenivorans sk43H]